MLAQVLPGLRELRGPLAAGYLWLLFAWLVMHENVEDAGGPVAELVDLGSGVSDAALAVAASFVAYLIGSLSEDAFGSLLRLLTSQVAKRGMPVDLDLATAHPALGALLEDRPSPRAISKESMHEVIFPLLRDIAADLTNERERLAAENVLRVAVIPPLTAIVLYLFYEDPVWGFAGLVLPAFFAQTYRRAKRIHASEKQLTRVWTLLTEGSGTAT